MPESVRVDPRALADAVERMTEFQHYTEATLAEIDSLVSHLRQARGAAAHAEARRHLARGQAMMHEALTRLTPVAERS